MALASYREAQSVTALSRSPLFHHQYSSIRDAISNLAGSERELNRVRRLFQVQWLRYFPAREVNHFQLDAVSLFREHSRCLPELQYVHKPNCRVRGNKPVGVGYRLSLVNRADFESSWSLPFEMRRVRSNEDAILVGVEQIRSICQRAEFASGVNINTCDSGYGTAKYFSQISEIKNLVGVVRLRHGIKVFEGEERETGGAPQIYGTKYYLTEETKIKKYGRKEKEFEVEQISIYDKPADEFQEIEKETGRGKRLRIEMRRWSAMKMRSKQGYSMKGVEFELIGIRVFAKDTGERVFKEDVFVAVVGEQRRRLSIEEVAENFYHRFDLEGTNRFMKQNLFLQSYQTPAVQHLENWLLMVQEAMWLLWAASEEVEQVCEKWQKYSEPKREKGERKTASQTRKGLERLFLSFEKEQFLPKKCKKGMGRKKGESQTKRTEYKVVKKGKTGEIWPPRGLQRE